MIYLDNAATTLTKPKEVYEKMDWVNRNLSVNAGRGSYRAAKEASRIIETTREMLLSLVHSVGLEKVVLTTSATEALNIILNGIPFKKGDVVFVSPYEHNAVARTLEIIKNKVGIRVELMPLDCDTLEIDLEKLKYMFIKSNPKCVCCTHVSNVTGYILPVSEIFQLARKFSAITVLDASQSMGLVPINVQELEVDFVAFAGHKTLYGPFGASGFVDCSDIGLDCWHAGGTGSDSLNLNMPVRSPERYEAASKNIVAIAGLQAALSVLNQQENFQIEKKMTMYAIEKLKSIPDVHTYRPRDVKKNHIAVISFTVDGYLSEDLGMILDEDFDIAVRTGYHCAPYIHQYLKDEEQLGTVRIGIGRNTTEEEIDALYEALVELTE